MQLYPPAGNHRLKFQKEFLILHFRMSRGAEYRARKKCETSFPSFFYIITKYRYISSHFSSATSVSDTTPCKETRILCSENYKCAAIDDQLTLIVTLTIATSKMYRRIYEPWNFEDFWSVRYKVVWYLDIDRYPSSRQVLRTCPTKKSTTDDHVTNKRIPLAQCSLMAENPGYSRNGIDLQDPIRNRDVAAEWIRKKKHTEGGGKGGNPSPGCSPILTTAVNHTSPLIGLNFLRLRAVKFKHTRGQRAKYATGSSSRRQPSSSSETSNLSNQSSLRNSSKLFINSFPDTNLETFNHRDTLSTGISRIPLFGMKW